MTNNPSQKCECDFDSPCCGAKKSIGHCLSCQKSESPATPTCKHKWKYKKVNGMAIRQCIKCDHSSRGITCYQSKSSELGKPTQPVGGVSENKPSTGEGWWEELKRDCKILQKYGEDTDYIIENTVIPFFRSMLQKEREKIIKRLRTIHRKNMEIGEDYQYAYGALLDEMQQILKDNQ